MKKMKSFIYLYVLLSISIFSACQREETKPKGKYDTGVFVINEGNFAESDGSVSFFDPITNVVSHAIFEAENNNQELNATIQSSLLYKNNIYLIGNNADKIVVVEAETFKNIATITSAQQLVNPQDLAVVGNKGYVSNWGDVTKAFGPNPESFISVIDLVNNNITKTIPLPARPQGVIAYGNNIYVALAGSNLIAVINSLTDELSGSITVPQGPSRMVLDANNKIWATSTSGSLVKINPENNSVEATISTGSVKPDGKLAINGAKDKIYFLSSTYLPDYTTAGAIYELLISATTAPTTPLITQKNAYGIGVNPADNIIYVANSNAFQGNGTIIRYKPDGTQLNNFAAGRGPSGFMFK